MHAIGVDICENSRVKKAIETQGDRFILKIFTPQEIDYCSSKTESHICYSARFAAKEALLKALGTGLRNDLKWRDIEICNDELGKPFFIFHGKTAEIIDNRNVLLSISHTSENAIAFVIIE